VDHHHDVGALRQGNGVAGLLVGSVAAVPGMDDRVDAEALRDRRSAVGAGVVDQDDIVDDFMRNFRISTLKRLAGILGGKHHCDFQAIDHAPTSRSTEVRFRKKWSTNCKQMRP